MPPSHTPGSAKRLESVRPPLRFTREFRNQDGVGDEERYPEIEFVTRSNVVMHSTTAQTPKQLVLKRALGRNFKVTARGPLMTSLRSNNLASQFSHFRFYTSENGQMLSFATGNTIRAGKHTHGDSVLAALRFQQWAHHTTDKKQPPWISACSTPNTVLTGKFKKPLNPTFSTAWCISKSSKFPGHAVTVPGTAGVTPEVFPTSGKFIVPGVTSVNTLRSALDHLHNLQSQPTTVS
ncbi:MAG: hypothetical protein ACPGR8_01205 [Limisphaerales bacterium]